MSNINPARGFASGFFGFFGVVAAIVLTVVVVLTWGSHQGATHEQALYDGTVPRTGADNPCIRALVLATHRFSALEDVTFEGYPSAEILGPHAFACSVPLKGKTLRVAFTETCASAVDPACVTIDEARLGKRRLRR